MTEINIEKHVFPAFATPIVNQHWDDAGDLNEALSKHLLKLEAEDGGVVKSNVGGWHSANDLLDSEEPCLQKLVERITHFNQTAIRHFTLREHRDAPGAMQLEGWANIIRDGQYNLVHSHPNSAWSGVYYVDVGEPTADHTHNGKLELLDPRPAAGLSYTEKSNVYGRLLLSPRPGQLVFFPSWLQHQVHPFFGKGCRISIAYNVTL